MTSTRVAAVCSVLTVLAVTASALPAWADIELSNVTDEEKFTIADFADRPILVESFAVWCPICLGQQREIEGLHSMRGADFVSISLDTDPNEGRQRVLEHVHRHGFDWRYAVAPPDMVRALIADFGRGIVTAPLAPLVLVCGDEVRQLRRGVKRTAELADLISNCTL